MRIFILYNSSSTLVYCCIISHHLHNIYTSHFFNCFTNCVNNEGCHFHSCHLCQLPTTNNLPLGKQTKCLIMSIINTCPTITKCQKMEQLVSFQLFFTKCPNLWSNHVSPHSTVLFLIFRNFDKHTQTIMSNMVISFHLKWFHLITLKGTPQPQKKCCDYFIHFITFFLTFNIVFNCVKSTLVLLTNISNFFLPNSFCLKIFCYLFS